MGTTVNYRHDASNRYHQLDFQFFPPNHSVARAPYEHPCVPYELFGVDQVGFFSGFFPVDAILESVSINFR